MCSSRICASLFSLSFSLDGLRVNVGEHLSPSSVSFHIRLRTPAISSQEKAVDFIVLFSLLLFTREEQVKKNDKIRRVRVTFSEKVTDRQSFKKKKYKISEHKIRKKKEELTTFLVLCLLI